MKTFISFLIFMSAVLSSVSGQKRTSLSPDDFEKVLLQPVAQVLDVRTAGEYQEGHIANAMQADWTNFDQFKDRVQYLEKDKLVMIYCAVGGRSSAAAQWLRDNGFADVRELKGGLTAWKVRGKSIEGTPTVRQMNMEEYNALVKSDDKVLVDFGAPWCPPCKKMEPLIQQLSEELKNRFKLVKIDGSIHTDLMKQLQIDAFPVFIVYKNGKEAWRKPGVVALTELKKQLEN